MRAAKTIKPMKKVITAAHCEHVSPFDSTCSQPALHRVIIQKVNPDNYQDRKVTFDKYLCDTHFKGLKT